MAFYVAIMAHKGGLHVGHVLSGAFGPPLMDMYVGLAPIGPVSAAIGRYWPLKIAPMGLI